MSSNEPQRTYLDYRNSLRKVNSNQSRSVPQTQSGTSSNSTSPKIPLAFRQAQSQFGNGNLQTPNQPGPQSGLQPGLQPSSSVHSQASSVSSYQQAQSEPLSSSPSLQRQRADTSTSTATASVYSQQSMREPAHGPRHLLVISAGSEITQLQQFLNASVRNHDVGSILLLGPDEEAIKKSKMDCYTVAGKLEKNLSVATSTYKSVDDIEGLSRVLMGMQNKNIYGVLCYLGNSVPEDDVLELDEGDMDRSWRSSVLILQTIARHTIPLLGRPQSQATGTSYNQGSPFLAIQKEDTSSHAPTFHTMTQEMLLKNIARSPMAQNVRIGSAQDLLPPPPPPPPVSRAPPPPPPIDIPQSYTNGSATNGASSGSYNEAESPTKLWASWALSEGA